MRSIKVGLAAAAVVGATVSGAYAAGVVNKSGHEVDDHAAKGQAIAAAARAKHAAPADPSAPAEPIASARTGTVDDSTAGTDPSASPTEKADQGRHYGQVKPHKHDGHAWGRGHGQGAVVLPPKPTQEQRQAAAHEKASDKKAAAAERRAAGRAHAHQGD